MEGDKPYSHIRLQCKKEKIEVWPSMNFMEIAGNNHYVARGVEYQTLIGHGSEQTTSASEAGCPVDRDELRSCEEIKYPSSRWTGSYHQGKIFLV